MKANLRILTVVAACAVFAVSCFAQGQGGGRQRGRGNQNSLSALVRRADVQAELKVTDDQKTKIEAMPRPGRGGGGGGGFAGGGGGGGAAVDPAEMAKRQADAREAEKKALAEILNPDQMKRLQELALQREGVRAITRDEIQTQLSLTDDQKAKVKSLMDKYNQANRDLMEKQRNQEMDRQAATEARTANTKTLTDELTKILTPEQADKLKALAGAPFTFEAGNGGAR